MAFIFLHLNFIIDNMKLGIFLHNLSHFLLPFLLFLMFSSISEELNKEILAILVFVGAFLPDIDHFKIFADYRFRNLSHFISYCLTTDRYRKTLLLFHNIPVILALTFSLPFFFLFNIYDGIFILSFLSHLILDLSFDLYSIGKISHWKIRRRI